LAAAHGARGERIAWNGAEGQQEDEVWKQSNHERISHDIGQHL
jgi:hypothetical protein